MESTESRRNSDGIPTECHSDKTLMKIPSEIRRDSVDSVAGPSQFYRVFHVPSVLGPN